MKTSGKLLRYLDGCHTWILGVQNPGANIITRCDGTKSHTYDEIMAQDQMSHLYYIIRVLYKINK
jgi:hypothetical protein